MIPFNKPSLSGTEFDYIHDAIRRGQLAGDGYYTKKCEALIEQIICKGKSMLTHSCTGALEMAAILCDIQEGDEVIMPSYTFVSTANAVVSRGGRPVFVDIREDTLNIDESLISSAITKKTRAIWVVHYAGVVAEMNSIIDIASNNNCLVVEDAAQALGSSHKDRMAGSFGDLAAFSFHETKNIISGEGGALVVNNEDLLDRAYIIREKGTNRHAFLNGFVDKYTWVDEGSSYLPGELIAAFLAAQLESYRAINARRKAVWDAYYKALAPYADAGIVRIPQAELLGQHNSHIFYIILSTNEERDSYINHMRSQGIYCPFHYVPLHSSPGGQKFSKPLTAPLPVTEYIAERLARLPLFASLSDQDLNTSITCTIEFLESRL